MVVDYVSGKLSLKTISCTTHTHSANTTSFSLIARPPPPPCPSLSRMATLGVATHAPFRESVSASPPSRREAEWDSVGIVDAGVLDLVAKVVRTNESFPIAAAAAAVSFVSFLSGRCSRRGPSLGRVHNISQEGSRCVCSLNTYLGRVPTQCGRIGLL